MQIENAFSTAEAAKELGVSAHEVRRLLSRGDLQGQQVANRWFISFHEVRRWRCLSRPKGRPYSPSTCWDLLAMIEGRLPSAMSASRAWKLRQHLEADDLIEFAGKLRRRAHRQPLFVHPSLRTRLLGDDRVLPSGVSALEAVGADLLARDDLIEFYVSERVHDELCGEFRLTPSPHTNVIAHVIEAELTVPFERVAPRSLVALDLMESGDPRTIGAGQRLWLPALDAARAIILGG